MNACLTVPSTALGRSRGPGLTRRAGVLASSLALALCATSADAQERSLFDDTLLEHLDDLSSPEFEAKPDISNNLRTLLYASAQPGGSGSLDLWQAERADQDSPFGTPVNVTELNTIERDHTPTTNADGTIIVYSSSRVGGLGTDDAWMATRAGSGDPWGAPVNLAILNSDKRDMGFTMTPDGLCLYYTSNRGTAGGPKEGTFDLFMSTRPDVASPWGAPTAIDELNTEFNDKFPSVTGDNLTMYFASDRPGSVLDGVGAPSLDLWVAMRADTASPWSVVENVFELNTEYSEYLMSVADDHSEMFFVSDRPESLGSFDLFRTTAVPSIARYGEGTAGVFDIPRLRTLGGAPVLGNEDFAFEITRMSPDDDAVILFGIDSGPGPLLVSTVDPFVSFQFQTAGGGNPPAGQPRVVPVDLRLDASLTGLLFFVQAVILDEDGDGLIGNTIIAATPGVRGELLAP